MSQPMRSPFGELLHHHHRTRMGLSYRRLEERADMLYRSEGDFDSVSWRTVLELEKPIAEPARAQPGRHRAGGGADRCHRLHAWL